MEKGILINKDNDVLYAGFKKVKAKAGLTWVKHPSNKLPQKSLIGFGATRYKYNKPKKEIFENPAYAPAKQAHETKISDLDTAIKNSPLFGLSIEDAEKFIDDNTAKVVEKAMLPFILKPL